MDERQCPTLVAIDADREVRAHLTAIAGVAGYSARACADVREAVGQADGDVGAFLLDAGGIVRGVAPLRELHQRRPDVPILIVRACEPSEEAVGALRALAETHHALSADGAGDLEAPGNRPTLREVEECYIDQILRETDGNKTEAARILGINRTTLYRRG